MADRGNQIVLAVHTSASLYPLAVLRAVRTAEDSTAAFVPDLAAFHEAYLGTQPPAFDAGPTLAALSTVRLRLAAPLSPGSA